MREIKFRAWDKSLERMTDHEELKEITQQVVGMYSQSSAKSLPAILVPINKNNVELMQNTGLKDKNGVEIYEGDVCRLSNDTYYSNHYFNTLDDWEMVTKVVWECQSFTFQDVTDRHASLFFFEADQDSIEIKIIGNIYENPELMEVINDN